MKTTAHTGIAWQRARALVLPTFLENPPAQSRDNLPNEK
jgi:hypothetical protein